MNHSIISSLRSAGFRLRTHFARTALVFRLRGTYILSVGAIAASMPFQGGLARALGYFGVAISLTALIIDTAKIVAEYSSLSIDTHAHGLQDDFQIYPTPHGGWMTQKIEISHEHWRLRIPQLGLSERAWIIQERMHSGSNLFDGQKVRICSDPSPGATLVLRPTSYFDGLVTNEFTGRRLMRQGMVVYDPIDYLYKTGRLLPLSQSPASNHLGVSMLVVTADNFVILQQASKRANVGSRKLGPSVSGSADWRDLDGNEPNLHAVGAAAILQEFREETSLDPDEWLINGIARSLGFGRIGPRGGLPELVFLAHSLQTRQTWETHLERASEFETERFVFVEWGSSKTIEAQVAALNLETSFSLRLGLHIMEANIPESGEAQGTNR